MRVWSSFLRGWSRTQLLVFFENQVHTHTGETQFWFDHIYKLFMIFYRCKDDRFCWGLLPELLHVFFVCVNVGKMTSVIRDPRAVIQRVLLLFLSCRNKSRYLSGVKLRCSKPHELILALDKSGITRDNFIPAIELIETHSPCFPEVSECLRKHIGFLILNTTFSQIKTSDQKHIFQGF